MEALDGLRLVAVTGIVWFHMHATGWRIAYSGLPALLALSIALGTMRSSGASFSTTAYRRGARLMVPWLFWSAIYGAELIARAVLHRQSLSSVFDPTMLISGTADHLWYLPFVFYATLVAWLADRVLNPLSPGVIWKICAATGGLMLLAMDHCPALPAAFGHWKFGAPAVPLGMAIGVIERSGEAVAPRENLLGIAGFVVLCALIVAALGRADSAIAYGIGVPMVCAALFWKPSIPSLVRRVVPLAMGIYVLHILVADQVVIRLASRLHTGPDTNAILVVCLAAFSTWLLRQSSFFRRFL